MRINPSQAKAQIPREPKLPGQHSPGGNGDLETKQTDGAGEALNRPASESHDWLASALKSAADAIVVVTSAGLIQFVNNPAERLIGKPREQIIGFNYAEILRFEHQGTTITDNLVELATLSGAPLGLGRDITLQSFTGDLHDIDGELSADCEPNGKCGRLIFTFRNIATRKHEEQQHREQGAIRAVERVAASTAQTLNDLLTIIHGNSELLEKSPSLTPNDLALIANITYASRSLAGVVNQLSTIAGHRFATLRNLNLNTFIDRYAETRRLALRPGINLEVRLSPDSCGVCADQEQLEKVLFSILQNAQDSIVDSGTITLSVERFLIETQERLATDKKYIRVTVHDTGEGMTPETLSRIFEPFFTLRRDKGHVGLGLSLVQGIVRDNEGFLTAVSTVGSGTAISFAIPEVDLPASRSATVSPGIAGALPPKTILIVEDDHGVRLLLRKFLEQLDYNILEAEGPEDALILAELQDEPIDLLLTDVAMPNISGPELVKKFALLRPESKYLLISGFPASQLGPFSSLPEHFEFLEKPFRQTDLFAKVKRLLDQPLSNP